MGRTNRTGPHTIGPAFYGDKLIPPAEDHSPADDLGPRFWCADLPDEPGKPVTLDSDQARHATRVLRLSEGAAVQLIDGRGRIARATLTAVDNPRQTICIVQSIRLVPALTPRIELATAIPKGPRADSMVNDLAQLGVDRLIPLIAERSVVYPRDNKLERFAKAAAEAGKQSGNLHFMQIDGPTPLTQALDCDADMKLTAHPTGQPLTGLTSQLAAARVVRVLIGPEGGFTDEEVAQANAAGFLPWRFNLNILRIETAAAAAVAVLRAQA